jgi:hypothetical protein
MIIKMQDIHGLVCVSGARAFGRRHGLDWRKFVREGLPEEDLLATGDAMAIKAVEYARGQK